MSRPACLGTASPGRDLTDQQLGGSMRRPLSLCAALAVCAGIFVTIGGTGVAGASYPPIPAGPIIVGATTPLSGPTAADGQSTQESFLNVTMKAFGAEFPNGIDGHQVQLKFLDDQGTVTGGVQTAEQLVSDHVAAVVTASYNPEAEADQYTIWQKNKIPVISVLSGNEYSNTKAYPYDFGTGASLQQEAVATDKWIKAEGIKKIAVLDDGLMGDVQVVQDQEADLKKYAPEAKVVTTQTVTPDRGRGLRSGRRPQVVRRRPARCPGGRGLRLDLAGHDHRRADEREAPDLGRGLVRLLHRHGPARGQRLRPLRRLRHLDHRDVAGQRDRLDGPVQRGDVRLPDELPDLHRHRHGAHRAAPGGHRQGALGQPGRHQGGLESIHNQCSRRSSTTTRRRTTTASPGPNAAAICQMAPPYAGGVGKVPIQSKKYGA